MRGSHIIIVSCGYCKTDIAEYKKAGKGRLLRMYVDRIIRSSIDLSKNQEAIFCPNCKEQLATKVTLNVKNIDAYIMIRGVFNTREVNR